MTEFAIDRIVVGKRKRSLGDIASLTQSISELGLMHPITILPDGTLVSGYHRLEACKALGWKEIPVNIRSWDELQAELAEIDENLIRNELKEIEQARHLQRRKEIYEGTHPETKQGAKGGWHNNKTEKLETEIVSVSSSFAEDTAKKTGVTDRTIRSSIQTAKNISSDLDSAILDTPIADNQRELLKLGRLQPEKQQAVVKTMQSSQGRIKSVRQATTALSQKEQYETPNDTDITQDDCQIYLCSVSELGGHVEPDSIDCIITDPPYGRDALYAYTDLARFAAYALKPGGSLIAMVGQYHLPDILNRLSEHLTYHWLSCYYTPGDTTKIWPRHIGSSWKPLLWFVKGKGPDTWNKDVVFVGEQKNKSDHEWGQPAGDMVRMIEHFTLPDQLICDPFVGGGSTAIAAIANKRRFVGCDIDEACVEKTRKRIDDALAAAPQEPIGTLVGLS